MNIPDHALCYIAEHDMTIRDVLETLYGNPSLKIINHVLTVNAHLDGDWIRAGQLLVVTPPDTKECALLEQQMGIAARHVDAELNKLNRRERLLLARHYALLSNLASYNISRYGWTTHGFQHHKKNLEQGVSQLDQLTRNSRDETNNSEFLSRHQQLLTKIDCNISGLLNDRLFHLPSKAPAIKEKLGLVSNAVVHQWKTQVGPMKTIAGFKSHYAHIVNTAKNLARLGCVSLALDVVTQKEQQAGLCADGALATTEHSPIGWPFNDGAYHLIIGIEAATADLASCSIVAGTGGRTLSRVAAASTGHYLFSRSYRAD